MHGFVVNDWYTIEQWPSGETAENVLEYAEWCRRALKHSASREYVR